jgi:ABC-type branched-subunit amino acid transport system ATPase component
MTVALALRGVSVHYRAVQVVHEVSLEVPPDTCVALIGANGAGKTSLLRGISGLVSVRRGSEIEIAGKRIERVPAEDRPPLGLGHVLEGRHIFPTLNVRENLELGLALGGGTRAERRERLDRVLGYFPLLTDLLSKPGASLSGGQQQFLAIARALAGAPRVLLLDEPSVGLAPELVTQLGVTIGAVARDGVAVLLVEQAIGVVQAAANTVYALSHGRVVDRRAASEPGLDAWAHEVYLR